jgi:hypothetical protein
MPQTIATIRKEVYKLLNEATNSTVGALSSGTGTVAAGDDSNSNINKFIMEGVADLCRSCVAIPATATMSFNANIRTRQLTSVTMTSPPDGEIWFVTDVYVNGTSRLTHASESSIRAHDLGYATNITAAASNILYWYRHDNYSVGVYPYSSQSFVASLYGYGVPDTTLSGVAGTDDLKSFDFLPDDLLLQSLSAYAATKIAMKNIDDPTLAERSFWKQLYDTIRMQLYVQLDNGLKSPGGPFSIPPVGAK